MLKRWAGPLVTLLIFSGVALIVAFNLNLKTLPPPTRVRTPSLPAVSAGQAPLSVSPKDFREYPIGEPVIKDGPHLRIGAVWLPPVQMEGMPDMGTDIIHLEADIHATEGNRQGFAKDEFVPYLKIGYTIAPAGGGPLIHQGELAPMVARDGLHYGASIAMPRAGSYRLTYKIKPPSAGGLGRHSDPATGVDPWWEPLEVSFLWDYQGPPQARPAITDRR